MRSFSGFVGCSQQQQRSNGGGKPLLTFGPFRITMPEETGQIVHHDGYSKGLEFTLSICLCHTLCVFGLRLFIRWRNFGIDDLIVLLSTALTFVFFGCGYASLSAGLSRSTEIPKDHISSLNTVTLVSDLSWITALCSSKLAVVLMLLRTTVTTSHRALQCLVGFLVAAQCVISITLITANCGPFPGYTQAFRSNDESCPRQQLRWRIITGCDVATELAILILPLQLVWGLQMPSRNKMIVIVAFWLRMPTIVFTLLRNNATNSLTSTTNTSLTASMVSIWQTIEMSYSVAAATIAALKRFTEGLNTGFGHGELTRVHGNTSQNYKLSDHSESSKGSKATNPFAARLNSGSAVQQEPEQVTGSSRGEYQLQELDLRHSNVFQGTGISSSPLPKIVDLDKGHRRQYG